MRCELRKIKKGFLQWIEITPGQTAPARGKFQCRNDKHKEYKCVSTDWKLAWSSRLLLQVSKGSLGGFVVCGGFFKLRTRFEQLSSHNQSSPFLPMQTVLFPICKEQPWEIITAINTQFQNDELVHQGTGKQYKTEGEISDTWGILRGLMWFAQWKYPPGVSPWRFLMGRGAFRQEVLLGKMCPEHFRLPEVV